VPCLAPPKSLPGGSWRPTVSLVSGMTTATGTVTVQLVPQAGPPSSVSAMTWVWLSLGGLALVLTLVMGRYALGHRRRAVAS
jgi:hypothetical protein